LKISPETIYVDAINKNGATTSVSGTLKSNQVGLRQGKKRELTEEQRETLKQRMHEMRLKR
jgi:hypothetical protein